jgi:two-component system, CAI-1 autoinducer sensor kinase/phosphatase CqsS
MPTNAQHLTNAKAKRSSLHAWVAKVQTRLRDFRARLRAANSNLLSAPIDPVLHASPWRLRLAGLFTAVGHPLFLWLWVEVFPQPWESPWLRWFIAALGVPLMFMGKPSVVHKLSVRWYFAAVCWMQLPMLFAIMYVMNGANAVWFATLCGGILAFFHMLEWRVAILGTALSVLVLAVLGVSVEGFSIALEQTWNGPQLVVLMFSCLLGMALGVSAANLRQAQLSHVMQTVGIMAHELRTPLATVSLIGDMLRSGRDVQIQIQQPKTNELGQRLHGLVRAMNYQIDTQINNAKIGHLRTHREVLSAQSVVRQALLDFPFRGNTQRSSVGLRVLADFEFWGSHAEFSQLVSNLLKNALQAVDRQAGPSTADDVSITVGTKTTAAGAMAKTVGYIEVSDRGDGIAASQLEKIFEPFYSTSIGSAHGLGLAFCQQVVQYANGELEVSSQVGKGSSFKVILPLRPKKESSK